MKGGLDFDLYVLGAIALLAVCSFLTRAGYFLFGDYFPLSDKVRRALRYAPTAALVGIVVPELLPWAADTGYAVNIKALAALAAVALYWRTRSSLLVIVGGMLVYWVLRLLSQLV